MGVAQLAQTDSGDDIRRAVAPALLAWYRRSRRDLPWRMAPGKLGDAYRVWLSEVMLQQTTVKAVLPYYERFLQRWPTVEALAKAQREEVLALWAGLGYYSRANNLHDCAQSVVDNFGGQFPEDEATLRRLPGIGPYTAAAIAAMAFGKPATPIDGNIERVVARLFAVEEPLPGAKPLLKGLAEDLTPKKSAGDFAQAMMDLGAGVCTPRRPSCMICPLERLCVATAASQQSALPARAPRPDRPVRRGHAFLALREDGYVLLRKRHQGGLLSNMIEVPSTDWLEVETPASGPGQDPASATVSKLAALRTVPVRAQWWSVPGVVSHTFTHFRLELGVYRAVVAIDSSLTLWAEQARCRWVHRSKLEDEALPSVMRKVLAHGLDAM